MARSKYDVPSRSRSTFLFTSYPPNIENLLSLTRHILRSTKEKKEKKIMVSLHGANEIPRYRNRLRFNVKRVLS